MRVMTKANENPWDSPNPIGIRMTRRTALRVPELPSPVPSAEGDRRVREERQAALERARAMSVVLAQPHRQYDSLERLQALFGRLGTGGLGEPFGRLCYDRKLGRHCWLAGGRYEEIVREARAAQGLRVPGLAPAEGDSLSNCDDACPPQVCAQSKDCRKARRQLALMRLRETNGWLISIMARAPFALERVVYGKLEPFPADVVLIEHCITILSDKWGYAPKRRHRA